MIFFGPCTTVSGKWSSQKHQFQSPLARDGKNPRSMSPRPAPLPVTETASSMRVRRGTNGKSISIAIDPDVHPLLHIIDDAPLLLMIAGTVGTLIHEAPAHPVDDTERIFKEQQVSWQRQVLIGVAFLLVGAHIISEPLQFFSGIPDHHPAVPVRSQGSYPLEKSSGPSSGSDYGEGIVQGICIMGAGGIAAFLPDMLWSLVILTVLGVWSCASAVILLAQSFKGRNSLPENFFGRIVIGGCSLLFALLLFIVPQPGWFSLSNYWALLPCSPGWFLS